MVYCGVFLFFFSALKVPCEDHTFKDSQQSVVHHERAPTQELVFRYLHCRGSCTDGGNLEGGGRRMSFTPEYTFMAAGVLRVVFVYDLKGGDPRTDQASKGTTRTPGWHPEETAS